MILSLALLMSVPLILGTTRQDKHKQYELQSQEEKYEEEKEMPKDNLTERSLKEERQKRAKKRIEGNPTQRLLQQVEGSSVGKKNTFGELIRQGLRRLKK